MIATEAALGVKPAKEYVFLLFGSPSGDYFPQGVKPISLWLCTDYVRAAPGGTGEAKCAGNYAASLVAQQKAIDEGCVQVIWLDAVETGGKPSEAEAPPPQPSPASGRGGAAAQVEREESPCC
jgi:branched-chain amino acid aminotransferase